MGLTSAAVCGVVPVAATIAGIVGVEDLRKVRCYVCTYGKGPSISAGFMYQPIKPALLLRQPALLLRTLPL